MLDADVWRKHLLGEQVVSEISFISTFFRRSMKMKDGVNIFDAVMLVTVLLPHMSMHIQPLRVSSPEK